MRWLRMLTMAVPLALVVILTSATGNCEEAAAPAAAAAPKIDTGDTSWVLISTALVMLMTPGLAFFYGGLVRRKNILSILMQCCISLCQDLGSTQA